MTENIQADSVQRRQAVFVRCCLNINRVNKYLTNVFFCDIILSNADMAELADAYGSDCAMIVNSKSVLFETDFLLHEKNSGTHKRLR